MSGIYVSPREYELSHGRKPRGRGSWAFFFDGVTRVEEAYWSSVGTYTQALAEAKRVAREKGHTLIEVGS
jgi:hypothetical protein